MVFITRAQRSVCSVWKTGFEDGWELFDILALNNLCCKSSSIFKHLYENLSRRGCLSDTNSFSCQKNTRQFRCLPLMAQRWRKFILTQEADRFSFTGLITWEQLQANQILCPSPNLAHGIQTPVHCSWCPDFVLQAVEPATASDTDFFCREQRFLEQLVLLQIWR